VWDVEFDTVLYFNFASGRGEDDDTSPPPNSADSMHSRDITALDRYGLHIPDSKMAKVRGDCDHRL
jgi:hypothetical protein